MRSWLALGFALVAILEVRLPVDGANHPALRAPTITVYKGPT